MALDDNTAVFCVARIPQDILDDFFRKAYSVPEFADEGIHDVGTHHHCLRASNRLDRKLMFRA